MRRVRARLARLGLVSLAVFAMACGSGSPGGHVATSATPSLGASPIGATPCGDPQCVRTNFHRQSLTFTGAFNGRADSALVSTCQPNPAGGYDLSLGELHVGSATVRLNLGVGPDYHGAAVYTYQANSTDGASGAVSAGIVNGTPIRYLMTAGTVSLNPDQQSGQVDADFVLASDSSKKVHVAGQWSCSAQAP